MLYDLNGLAQQVVTPLPKYSMIALAAGMPSCFLIWFISSEESVEFILGASTSHDCSLRYYH